MKDNQLEGGSEEEDNANVVDENNSLGMPKSSDLVNPSSQSELHRSFTEGQAVGGKNDRSYSSGSDSRSHSSYGSQSYSRSHSGSYSDSRYSDS